MKVIFAVELAPGWIAGPFHHAFAVFPLAALGRDQDVA